ncbi:MAG: 7,8-didemethyl-8-hydroxy-5-deazariboflavin synthase subunit CofH [Deltaproteobacteria bacterium]|jgi:FO synthase|nr:7,8-didemethyl-8-hydroxy-5-deazariboflavin synthase subunit CofH [Deltaproteobacteria bacterium]
MLERLVADVTPEVARLLDRALDGQELSVEDALRLLRAEGPDFHALLRAADVARKEDCGDDVSFVITRNINFTNVCYVGCSFCGFARHRDEAEAFDRSFEEINAKARNAVSRGATEVCIQGGIDPDKDHHHYREILTHLKAEFPDLHIHAFSPEEMDHISKKSGMPLPEQMRWLMEAGLDTMPGTAAEILDDSLRQVLSPNKLMTERWKEIVRAAHSVGLRSTATIMYGHIEEPEHVARHLEVLRSLQKETGGFTEFVPLGFIHEKNVLGHWVHSRPGPSGADDLRLIAVSRLFLRPHITNVQMSWVKMGPKLSQLALEAGANDFGGTLMEESISRESGSDYGENLPAEEMRRLIREMGRTPVQRSTTYEVLERFADPEKDPPSLEPTRENELAGPTRWRAGAGKARLDRAGQPTH